MGLAREADTLCQPLLLNPSIYIVDIPLTNWRNGTRNCMIEMVVSPLARKHGTSDRRTKTWMRCKMCSRVQLLGCRPSLSLANMEAAAAKLPTAWLPTWDGI